MIKHVYLTIPLSSIFQSSLLEKWNYFHNRNQKLFDIYRRTNLVIFVTRMTFGLLASSNTRCITYFVNIYPSVF